MTDSEKLDLILSEMQGMKTDIQSLKAEMQDVKAEMQGMKTDIQSLKADLEDVKQRTAKIELIIENEIRVNIQRVAEGHLDLSRNLHEAMKPNSEIEMLGIKVRRLEMDVKELKQKIS